MTKHQSIINAIEANDLRRARRLIDAELAPKGSRAFDDIAGVVQRVFVSAGEKCPALSVRYKQEVHKAAVGVDDFMIRFGIVPKSHNRVLLIELVCRHIIDFIRVPPTDASEDEAREHFKIPPYMRSLYTLSDVNKIVSSINIQFPGYLDSGLAGMVGFEMA